MKWDRCPGVQGISRKKKHFHFLFQLKFNELHFHFDIPGQPRNNIYNIHICAKYFSEVHNETTYSILQADGTVKTQ